MFKPFSFSPSPTHGTNTPTHAHRKAQTPINLDFLEFKIEDPVDSFSEQNSPVPTSTTYPFDFRANENQGDSYTTLAAKAFKRQSAFHPDQAKQDAFLDAPSTGDLFQTTPDHSDFASFERSHRDAAFNALLHAQDNDWVTFNSPRQASIPRAEKTWHTPTPSELDEFPYPDFDTTDDEEDIARSIEIPPAKRVQTQKTHSAFTNPNAKWSQLSDPEKATLLTIVAHPRHFQLQERTVQKFLEKQYGYQVSQSAIKRCQQLLKENDANDVWEFVFNRKWAKLPDGWNSKKEDDLANENSQILRHLLGKKGLDTSQSLISYTDQPLIPRNTDSVFEEDQANSSIITSKPIASSGQTSQGTSPKSRSHTSSPRTEKRKAEALIEPNPFQLSTTGTKKAGNKRDADEQEKILTAIEKNHQITATQLINQRLVGARNTANTYIGLMQYFNYDKSRVLQLLSELPRGGTLPKAKQAQVLSYIAQQGLAVSTYQVMAECKVGHDTVEGYKKHLTTCSGNLQTALTTEPPKKRKKKQKTEN